MHLIGKDIVRFHTIYWPIMLLALGEPLPKQVFGHPWMLVGEDKMSKSRGNTIYADDLVHFFGVDAVRYFSLHEMPFAQDGSITWELMIERINSDLANVYGNLVNRTIAMANKYFDGVLLKEKQEEALDEDLKAFAKKTVDLVEEDMNKLRVADAIEDVIELLRRCNKYIDETAPWVLAKDPTQQARLSTVLYNLLEGIRVASILITPFMPETAEKVFSLINTDRKEYDSVLTWGNYEAKQVSSDPKPLFQRIDTAKQLDEIHAYLEEKHGKPVKKNDHLPTIGIEDFSKLEIRVGTVLSSKKHEKADKLLVSQVDIGGGEVRQIVSGIASVIEPEEFVGKKVLVVVNLKPAKIRGVESNGMILCADQEGKMEILSCGLEAGSLIR